MQKVVTSLYRFFPLSFLIALALLGLVQNSYAQCSASTPVYNVDLTGKPNGSWTSPTIRRDGTCCSVPNNQTCVQFNITLDKLSGGLQFQITSGPVPSGVMTYQVNCGAPKAVGDSICVTGAGPHELTICMPGNSSNTFTVRSIAAYEPVADANVTGGCSTTLNAPIAFDPATVQWNDITGGGTYNKYLSCTSGCGTTTVTPDANPPAFVDYTICGNSESAVCSSIPYCDTVRVYFHKPIVASISPTPAIICPGNGSVELVGSATGGSGYYNYFWFDGAGNLLANAQKYNATAIGTYKLEVRNENYPSCTPFTSSITVTENLTVNAGPDQEVCANSTVQLAGAVTAATGGIWSGGKGSFSPNNTTLNAVYTPTPDEVAARTLTLTLTTTGNGSCTPLSDRVNISFHSFAVSINAPPTLCSGSTTTLAANTTGGLSPFTYSWSTGERTQSISNKPVGTYTVTVTDSKNCTFQASTTITAVNSPSDFNATPTSSTCGGSNGSIAIASVSGGTGPYTYSKDGVNFQTSGNFGSLTAQTYPITVKDANNCTFTKNVTVADIAGPSDFTTSLSPATCGETNGQITISSVIGGTTPYTYSRDGGINFQSSAIFSNLAAGSYNITIKDANNCTTTKTVPLANQAGPTAVSATAQPASCTNNNGRIDVGAVSGGTGPYNYSINGTTFQSGTSFTGLASGNYTVTARDVNGCVVTTSATVGKVEPTDLTATLTPSTCSGPNGKIVVSTVTGGRSPYTYSINGTTYQTSNTFSSLTAGDYSVRVKDANECVYTKLVKLTDQAGPSALNLSQTASTCGGTNGQINVISVSGGTAPYLYSKDGVNFVSGTSFTGLLAGNHTITVKDANNCTFAKGITVNNIAGPTDLTISPVASTCGDANGELLISSVTGGASPYMYSIDGSNFQIGTSFTRLNAGSYTITVKDANECTFAKGVNLSNIPGPTGFNTSLTSSTCGASNGKIEISAVTGGTAPYIYSINGGSFQGLASFSGLAAGIHTIRVKDANECLVSKEITLQNIAGPTAVNANSQPASCTDDNGSIVISSVTGGTSPYTYSINGTTFQSGTSFTGLASGSYTVTARDANGCTITRTVAVAKVNPTDLTTTLTPSTCSGSNGQIVVSSVTGGLAPYTYSLDETNYQASNTFNGLMSSSYTVRVKDANGCVFAKGVTLTDQPAPTAMELSQTTSNCSLANGGIEVGTITGGRAPYTYSKDGSNFQSSTSFTQLLAGPYTITVKDFNGCTFTKGITVTDIPGPSGISKSSTASTCGNENGSLAVNEVRGGTAPYTYSIDGINFQEGGSFNNLKAGNYTITVKDANGCLYTEGIAVNDQAGPSAFTATTTSSTCGDPNGQISISSVINGTTPYSYSTDGINFQASATLSGLSAATYTVFVKDANGCQFSKEVNLANIPGPTAVNTSSQPATCLGNDGSIQVQSVTGGTAPYSYSLDNSDFQSSTSFTAVAFGRHTLIAKDDNGCLVSTTVMVERVGPMDMTFNLQPSNCGESNGAITISSVSGGRTPYTYSIDGSNYVGTVAFNNLASGLYTLWVKDANNCTYSEEVNLSDIGGATAVAISKKPTTCSGSNGEITVNGVTGGLAPYSYSLNGGAFQTTTTFPGLAAATYTLQVKDANACIYVEEVVLEDIPAPSGMTISTASSTCSEANGSLTINAVSGGTASYTYSIDGTNFQTSNSFKELSARTYTVTVKDANNCTFQKEATVTDVPGPTEMSLSSTSSRCSEANGSITVNGVTGGNEPYAYSLDGTTFQTASTFENQRAGDYRVFVKDVNGCLFSKDISISDIAGPTALNVSTTATSCANNSGKIEISSVSGGTAPYTYSINGTTFQEATAFSNLASGNYTLIVKDALACTFSATATVGRIEPTDLEAAIEPSTCGNSNGKIRISGVSGGLAPYTYSIGGMNFQSSTEFTGLSAGTYTMVVRDANGCSYSEKIELGDLAGPSALTAVLSATTCGNANGTITISEVTAGTSPYTYSINGGAFQTGTSFTKLLAATYSITVKDANGCTYSEEVSLENIPGPTDLTLTSTSSTCGNANGTAVVSRVNGGTSPFTYSIDGTNFSSEASFASLLAGTYSITVKDANGCTYSKEVRVENIAGPESLAATSTSSTCGQADGSVEAGQVTGGTAPYTFSLNGGAYQAQTTFSGIAAGEHLLRARDANGCVVEKKVQVSNIGGPTDLTATSTAATCSDSNGSITVVSVEGNTAPYTYSVDGTNFQTSGNFSRLKGGTYSVSVKDVNGCLFLKEVVVQDEKGPASISASTTPTACSVNNGTITIESVRGGKSPFSYSLDGNNYQSRTTFSGLGVATYTIYVKDANGCVATFKESVITVGPQSAETTITSASCGESDGAFTVNSVNEGTAPYTYSIDGTNYQSTTSFSALLAGSYTLSIKDAGGCILQLPVNISNNDGPVDFSITSSSSTCGNENGRLEVGEVTGGSAPFTYSIDGITYQSGTSFRGLAEGEYQIGVKDANGCLFFKSATISNIEGPAYFSWSVRPSTCGSANGEASVSEISGGTSPFTYSIDGTNFSSEASFNSLLASTYTITVKDANGCTFSREIKVENIAGPQSLEASSSPASCGQADGSVEFGQVTGGTAPYTFSLNGGAYQAQTTFSGIAAGEHLLRARDANGCVVEKKVQVSNIGGPTDLTATSTAATCGDSNGSITVVSVEGNTAPYTYSVDGTNFQTSASFTNLKGGTYTLNVKDVNGCLYLEEVEVQDESSPSGITASSTPTSCTTDNGTITIESVSGGKSPFTYSLDGNSYQSSTTFNSLAAATYTIYVKDANGCVATFNETVITTGPQSAETNLTNASCGESDGAVTVGAVSGGTAPYTYSIDGANFKLPASFTGLAAGSYTLYIKDAGGCLLQEPFNISNNGGPEDFTSTISNASCGSTNGSIEFGTPTGGTAPFTYSIDGTNYQAGNTFSGLAEGDYQLSVKDANGCLLFKSATITNTEAPSDVKFTFTPESCGEKNASVTVESVTGGTAPYTYSLNGTDFQESTTFTALKSGSKMIYVKDKNGCVYSEYFEIEGTEGPTQINFSTKDSGCEADGEIEISEVVGGTGPYTYSIDGLSYQESPMFNKLEGNNYTVYVKDANNCIISDNVFINRPGFTVMYKSDISCYGEDNGMIALEAPLEYNPEFSIDGGKTFQPQPLFSNLKKGNYNIIGRFGEDCLYEMKNVGIKEPDSLWAVVTPTAKAIGNIQFGSAVISQFKGGVPPYTFALDNDEFGSDTVFHNLKGGHHVIHLMDDTGCSREFPFIIDMIQDIDIPNGFTPNGDNINDTWVLRNISLMYPQCKVMVFNRWGQEVFQSTGYTRDWDGTHKGKSLPDGTYYFIVQLNETDAPIKGSLTIMR